MYGINSHFLIGHGCAPNSKREQYSVKWQNGELCAGVRAGVKILSETDIVIYENEFANFFWNTQIRGLLCNLWFGSKFWTRARSVCW